VGPFRLLMAGASVVRGFQIFSVLMLALVSEQQQGSVIRMARVTHLGPKKVAAFATPDTLGLTTEILLAAATVNQSKPSTHR